QFVGFGLVDRFEAEHVPGDADSSPSGASCDRTWFHPGGAIDLRGRLTDAYGGDPDEKVITTLDIEDPASWSEEELADAVSAAAGRVIRTERYALTEDGQRAVHPIETVQHRYALRRLQPATGTYPASVLVHQAETLSAV